MKTLKEAESIAGKLSRPSKMPGYAYGIPAQRCIVGSILAKRTGTICSDCYALKGRYVFPNVRAAQEKRFASLQDPLWVDAMVFMIKFRNNPYFRWHDSGDIQGLWHLDKIVEVALRCPEIQFWLPTREYRLVKAYSKPIPSNLVIRVSAMMIDGPPPAFPNTSGVVTDGNHTCPAPRTANECGRCRACWDGSVKHVTYGKH